MRQEASNVLSIEMAVALAAQDKKIGGCFFAVCFLSVVSSKSFVSQWDFYLWPPLRNVWSNTDFPCCFVARTLYTPEFKAL